MRDLAAEPADLEQRGLRRHCRLLDSPQGAHVRVDGRDYLSFASNDYLVLAADPRIAEAAADSVSQFCPGAGTFHLPSVEIMQAQDWRRRRLIEWSSRICPRLELRRRRLRPSQTTIQTLIVGDNSETGASSDAPATEAILVPAARPPKVSKRSARLRLSSTAAHTQADADLLLETLRRAEASIS